MSGGVSVMSGAGRNTRLIKKRYLDGLGVADHGVDPDAPKNVSKSITAD